MILNSFDRSCQRRMGSLRLLRSMAANYRHRIEDDRLLDVVNHVREWLFAVAPTKAE